jgi:hypothetical protein
LSGDVHPSIEDFMKSILPAAALALAVSACSGGDAGSNSSAGTPQQNLEAENFSTIVDSDNAVMNAVDAEQLNQSGGEGNRQ